MKRIELYNLVWARPVTHVAKEFGVSDVAVRKVCVKHGIPTPPLGYWAKLQHGKKVRQTPHPALKEGHSDYVGLNIRPNRRQPPELVDVSRIAAQEGAAIKQSEVVVPYQRPARLHPLAAATEKALRKARPDHEGFVASQQAGTVDVRVGSNSIERVVLLIHALVHAALDRGHQLSEDADIRILVDEQPLAVRIYETKDKAARPPTAAELKQLARQNEQRLQFPSLYPSPPKDFSAWNYFPSGRLALEVSDPKQVSWKSDPIFGRWRDRRTRRLEDYLTEMLVALKTGGAIARHERAKEAEEARLAKEAEERRREQAIQRRLLEKVTTFLMEKADKFAQLVKLENLAAHLGSDINQPDGREQSELQRALEFALVNLRGQISADSINQEIIRTGLLQPEDWY